MKKKTNRDVAINGATTQSPSTPSKQEKYDKHELNTAREEIMGLKYVYRQLSLLSPILPFKSFLMRGWTFIRGSFLPFTSFHIICYRLPSLWQTVMSNFSSRHIVQELQKESVAESQRNKVLESENQLLISEMEKLRQVGSVSSPFVTPFPLFVWLYIGLLLLLPHKDTLPSLIHPGC